MADTMQNELYELTTLQIRLVSFFLCRRDFSVPGAWMFFAKGGSGCRDLQSYVSRLFLLVAKESSKLVFIVDNGPWTSPEYRFRPAELWQLMVTQVSPPFQVFKEESIIS